MVPRVWKTLSLVLIALTLILGGVLARSWLQGIPGNTATEVTETLNRQRDAWNAGDLDGYMADYRMSDETTMFGGPNVRTGWTVIMDNYRKKYQGEGKSMGNLAFDDVVVESVGPGVAFARGRWHVVNKDGESGGLFTLLLKRIDGKWKIVHDHTS